jgi:hypothetical protein
MTIQLVCLLDPVNIVHIWYSGALLAFVNFVEQVVPGLHDLAQRSLLS